MHSRVFLSVLAAAFMVSPAYARYIGGMQPHCTNGMQQNITLNVGFSIHADSFADAKKKFDDKMAQVNNFAKQQKIDKFELQSMNYNINAQGGYYEEGMVQPGYQLSGNANYTLDSSDSAFKLGEFLTQQKFRVSINANQYRNAMCMNGPDATSGASQPAIMEK